eukprot:121757_1
MQIQDQPQQLTQFMPMQPTAMQQPFGIPRMAAPTAQSMPMQFQQQQQQQQQQFMDTILTGDKDDDDDDDDMSLELNSDISSSDDNLLNDLMSGGVLNVVSPAVMEEDENVFDNEIEGRDMNAIQRRESIADIIDTKIKSEEIMDNEYEDSDDEDEEELSSSSSSSSSS